MVRKLEEKERLLQTNLMTVEKELAMRQQAMEMHKRYTRGMINKDIIVIF